MKKVLKQAMVPFLCLLFLTFLFFNMDRISDELIDLIKPTPELKILEKNNYAKNDQYLFVKPTTNFTPYSKQDLKNIFYTIVNNGWEEFTFYCPSEYTECLKDVKEFSQNQDLLTHLNNFVHPYNGFSNVKTEISENGEITTTIKYFYEKQDIEKINQKINSIYEEIIFETMSIEEKIRAIHDYIINNTKYDVERNNNGESIYHSYIALGPLLEGYGTCNGYTDAMALFLSKMNIPNFKVAMTPENNEDIVGHVWNAVYINDSWLHLDLTWDDPVSVDGNDYLQHKYFLITTTQLKEADNGEIVITEHNFKQNIYIELKEH